MSNKYSVDILNNENMEGKGVYEEIVYFSDGMQGLVHRLGYERVGFNADAGKAGTITITSINLPDEPDSGVPVPGEDVLIPEMLDCEVHWSDDIVSAPVTAIAAYASSNEKENDSFIKSLKLPKTLKSVGRCAFTVWCCMKKVEIPASVTEIGEFAFGYDRDWSRKDDEHYVKIDGFVIHCYPGTAGEKYAKDNGFEYVLLTD